MKGDAIPDSILEELGWWRRRRRPHLYTDGRMEVVVYYDPRVSHEDYLIHAGTDLLDYKINPHFDFSQRYENESRAYTGAVELIELINKARSV